MAQDLYAPYKPKSKAIARLTLIPTNLALPAQQALDACTRSHGDIDEFVMHRLGYGSREQMYGVLYAEQIDALALAFDQKDRGKIFLNGDQTGNGKGRFGAANIIDAKCQGYIPVFVTQKPNLYKSMLEDLSDIGFADIQPFFTNNNERIALSSGRVLRTGNAASQDEEMRAIAQQGDLGGYDAIFTTYNQLQSVNRKDTPRREFLRAIAEQCVFIFDESHEAGGSVNKQDEWSTSGAMNRADFVRWLVDNSASAIFMSATATKDPAVMDLYARGTDAVHAVSSMAKLENTLKAGGIPLQQMMAAQFGFAGNMLRRERSMENISFQAKVVGVDHEIADRISSIMRAIDKFDRASV
ncbi:MAG: DEAD/DEAH box helicase family protein [Phormidesmis sp. RL_2_1]|nr:DEAD/DEAH box helicase family protein [Phormidesmis sp. RL_2_1]